MQLQQLIRQTRMRGYAEGKDFKLVSGEGCETICKGHV